MGLKNVLQGDDFSSDDENDDDFDEDDFPKKDLKQKQPKEENKDEEDEPEADPRFNELQQFYEFEMKTSAAGNKVFYLEDDIEFELLK